MTIPYDSFPATYEACWLSGCELQEKCLHYLYYQMKPKDVTRGPAILPAALSEENLRDGRCRYFREAVTVKVYADFSHLFDEVKTGEVQTVREEVYDLLGGARNFRRYSNAEGYHVLTEPLAEQVNAIFHSHGYPTPRYGRTFSTVVF